LQSGVDNEKHFSLQSPNYAHSAAHTEMHSSYGAQASTKPYSRQAPGRCVACTPHRSIPANAGAKRQQLAGLERSGTDRCALSPIGSSPASPSRPQRAWITLHQRTSSSCAQRRSRATHRL